MKFLLALLFLSSSAFADMGPLKIKGNWSVQGIYVLENKVTHCDEFIMEFNATADTFSFVGGNRKCEDHDEQFFQVDMTYKDGKVFYGPQVVGSYTENSLEASFQIPEGSRIRTWRMNMRVTGDQLLYEESRFYNDSETPYINFAGIMVSK